MRPFDAWTLPLEGVQLVEASAGTGKTFSIANLYLRLLLDGVGGRRVDVEQVLVVTFTRAATAELRERIRARLREAMRLFRGTEPPRDPTLLPPWEARSAERREIAASRLELAVRSIDAAQVNTIHGFCQAALTQAAFASGARFDVEVVQDASTLLRQCCVDAWHGLLARATAREVTSLVEAPGFEAAERFMCDAAYTPGAELRPRVTWPAFDALADAYAAARAVLVTVWRSDRDGVRRALESPALNRNKYRPASCAELLQLLAELEASPERWRLDDEALDRLELLTQTKLADAVKKGQGAPQHPIFTAGDRCWTAREELLRGVEQLALAAQIELAEQVRSELPRRIAATGGVSFDGLLTELDRALAREGGEALATALAERWPVVLVDEFQDTDEVQYRVFLRLARAGATLLLIGDPKQAIYAFRGADVNTYLAAARAVDEPRTLEVNYRSDPGVLSAINRLFGREGLARPFGLDDIGFIDARPRAQAVDGLRDADRTVPALKLAFVAREEGERELGKGRWGRRVLGRVAAEIARLLTSGASLPEGGRRRAVGPGDVAVLVRTNARGLRVQRELRALGVPAVLQGTASIYDEPEAGELLRVMGALLEPNRTEIVRAALATGIFGVEASEFAGLRSGAELEAWIDAFARARGRALERGFFDAFRWLAEGHGLYARLLAWSDGARRATNLRHLVELLHGFEQQDALPLEALRDRLAGSIAESRHTHAAGPDAELLRLDSDARAVRITTIHRAKGLEYPIVFCPDLWDGLVRRGMERKPLRYHDGATRVLDLNRKDDTRSDRVELARAELVQEDARLVYVALTRAVHHVHVVWGRFSGVERSALGHLLHGGSSAEHQTGAQRLAKTGDFELRNDLEVHARAVPGAIEVVDLLPAEAVPRYRAREPSADGCAARSFARRLDARFETTSYSRLTRARDESPLPRAAALPSRFDHLGRGAAMGTLLHELFERADFDGDVPALLELLRGHGGVELADAAAEEVAAAMHAVLHAPLLHGAPLAEVAKSDRLAELEFTLSLGDARASGGNALGARLAACFERQGPDWLRADYAGRLRGLSADPHGFLTGAIDLVFRRGDRFHLLDWKSNALDDYGPERIRVEMLHHDYVLQYHLYQVALHRHLRAELADYDYDRHVGAAFYLFVRGIEAQPGAGVFHERPTRALVEALDRALDGDAP